jgi:hypothetical protein
MRRCFPCYVPPTPGTFPAERHTQREPDRRFFAFSRRRVSRLPRTLSVYGRAAHLQEPQLGTGPRGEGRHGPGLHPCRSRVGEDDHDHEEDRQPGCVRHLLGRLDPGGHLHRQGGGRDARAAGGAGGSRGARADVPRGRARATATSQQRAARPDPPVEGDGAPLAGAEPPPPLPVPAGRRPGHRDRMG